MGVKSPPATIEAMLKTLPPAFTGKVIVTLNIHKGSAGPVVVAVEQRIAL